MSYGLAVQISAREAASMLATLGLGRGQARRVLDAGLAGRPTRAAGASLYDADNVSALLERRLLTAGDLDPACQEEMFLARVSPRAAHGERPPGWRGADLTAPPAEQRAAIRSGWRLSPYARLRIRLRVERDGFMPLVATVCGFVVLGADLVAACPDDERLDAHLSDERSTVDLEPPGRWFEPMRAARFVTGPGSPWSLWSRARGQRTW